MDGNVVGIARRETNLFSRHDARQGNGSRKKDKNDSELARNHAATLERNEIRIQRELPCNLQRGRYPRVCREEPNPDRPLALSPSLSIPLGALEMRKGSSAWKS